MHAGSAESGIRRSFEVCYALLHIEQHGCPTCSGRWAWHLAVPPACALGAAPTCPARRAWLRRHSLPAHRRPPPGSGRSLVLQLTWGPPGCRGGEGPGHAACVRSRPAVSAAEAGVGCRRRSQAGSGPPFDTAAFQLKKYMVSPGAEAGKLVLSRVVARVRAGGRRRGWDRETSPATQL